MAEMESGNMETAMLLSAGAAAAAEHEVAGCEAGKAIDGQADTYWAGAPYYKWWKLDLLSLCRVGQIRLAVGRGAGECTHYYVEASADQLNWETVIEYAHDDRPNGEETAYEVDLTARYLRVTVTYCSAGETASIRDFRVYGRPAGQAPGPGAPKAAQRKFLAEAFDESDGFEASETDEIEPGLNARVLTAGTVGSYLLYRGVDFGAGADQLRGMFGFADLDKSKHAVLEVRLDAPNGTKVGELTLFKQWKRWSNLAGDLILPDALALTGVHDVYLRITGLAPGQQLMIYWLMFGRRKPLPVPRPAAAFLPPPADGEYGVYFGNLHSHTGFSDGIGVPEHAYDYARHTAGLDFLAITEHSNLYDHDLDWSQSRKWRDLGRTAERKSEDGIFLALHGAETTWYNQFGHMNTYNMDCFINAYELRYNDIGTYYEAIKRYPDSIQQWNHPWSCGDRHLDGFAPYDAELDRVLHLLEVNPIESKELGGLYYYVRALDLGWHVAPVGSQDNHHGQWGTENTLRTGVLAEQLTREHFYDALRRQRAYFTSALHLQVWFRVNGAIMGSRIPRTEQLSVEIRAEYREPTGRRLVKAELIGEGGRVLQTFKQAGDRLDIRADVPYESRYCFVRLIQDDGEFAATAPVWLE